MPSPLVLAAMQQAIYILVMTSTNDIRDLLDFFDGAAMRAFRRAFDPHNDRP
jgi:hypothetical protein